MDLRSLQRVSRNFQHLYHSFYQIFGPTVETASDGLHEHIVYNAEVTVLFPLDSVQEIIHAHCDTFSWEERFVVSPR